MDTITAIKPAAAETVAALGYFDGVHLGHRAVIGMAVREAEARSASAAVLTFDMHELRAAGKGSGDLFPYVQSDALIRALGVDILMRLPFGTISGMACEDFVPAVLGPGGLRAKAVCCGADFRFGRGRCGDVDMLRRLCYNAGIDVLITGEVEVGDRTVSTTAIKSFVSHGDIPSAAALLGHPYGFCLPVVEDQKLARRLGFPTINQRFPAGLIVPREGVYFSTVRINDSVYNGVSNLGTRPTVGGGAVMLETHILDFSGDLYGQTVCVELQNFLRDEQKFDGEQALRAQVLRDIESVRASAAVQT